MFKDLEDFKKLVESNPEFKKTYYKRDNSILTKDQNTGELIILPNDAIIKLHQGNGVFIEVTVGNLLYNG